ncbi:MAG: inositol monophosphatase family protein [Marinicaulis sp.]|nr:inositol monophosphatase family protein [Marinicaulis sp.]
MAYSADELNQYAAFALRLADAARGQTLQYFRKRATVFNKAGVWFDPVTDADREAERIVRRMIGKVFPDHGVLGEEFGEVEADGPWRWVLDPVDGTRAFVCGVASWATLIALEYEGDPILGIIDQPYTDECWFGVNGKTVFRHGEDEVLCETSGLTDLAKARISTTDPRANEYFRDHEAATFERLTRASRLARFSLDAYAYGLLAIGELDIVLEAGLQRHDFSALAPVIEGAGGVITNWSGEKLGADDRGETLAAATPELHKAALAILNEKTN